MKKLLLVGIVFAILLVQTANCQTTSLKSGDWITYKAKFRFEGTTLTDVINSSIGIPIPESTQLTMQQIMDAIEQTSLKITIIENNTVENNTDANMPNAYTINFYLYYNETLNFNTTQIVSLVFPYLANYQTVIDNIPVITIPEIQLSVVPMVTIPEIQVSVVNATHFYAGMNRAVTELRLHAENLQKLLGNNTNIPNTNIPIPNVAVDAYADWDKEYEIFLGAGVSFKFSSVSWVSYNALEIFVDQTNLWSQSYADIAVNFIYANILSYPSNMVSYAIDGIEFGNMTSLMYCVAYIAVGVVGIILMIYLIKRLNKRRKTKSA